MKITIKKHGKFLFGRIITVEINKQSISFGIMTKKHWVGDIVWRKHLLLVDICKYRLSEDEKNTGGIIYRNYDYLN